MECVYASGYWSYNCTRKGLALGDYFVAAHGLSSNGHIHDNMPYQVVGILEPNYNLLDTQILTSLNSVWDIHPTEEDADKEITALLVTYKNRNAAFSFPRMINNKTSMQAASPAFEITRLSNFMGIGKNIIMFFGCAFILFALISIAISLFEKNERKAI